MNQPEHLQPDRQRLLDSMEAHLSSARRSGIRIVSPLPSASHAAAAAAPVARETLEEVLADLGACTRCGLCSHRTSIVFGQGNQHARLVFVGEAPLPADDAAGEPFSGPEGDMLTKIITRVLNLTRPDVYLTTCRKMRTTGWARSGAGRDCYLPAFSVQAAGCHRACYCLRSGAGCCACSAGTGTPA